MDDYIPITVLDQFITEQHVILVNNVFRRRSIEEQVPITELITYRR